MVAIKTQSEMFSGPIPHPEILGRYEEIIPGAANRILVMAEEQSAHRQGIEKSVVKSDILKSYWGLGAAFLLALLFGGMGSLLVYYGQPWAGAAIATGPVVGLVTAFLVGTSRRREEREEKAKLMLAQRGK